MLIEHEVTVAVGRFTRSWGFDSNWDEVSTGDIEAWSGASSRFLGYEYECAGFTAKIYADLSPFLREIEQERDEARLRWADSELPVHGKVFRAWDGQLTIRVVFDVQGESPKKLQNIAFAKNFVEKYLYDLFLVINLSSPGGCDFLNISIPGEHSGYVHRLELSSYNFEMGSCGGFEGKSIALGILSFEQVFAWYKKLNLGIRQQPESSLERGLFALLHACRSNADAASLVWIFHALEAIYQTRVGSGFTDLFERISFVLDLDGKGKKYLKSELRRMYDLRSSFVHGGYRIHHPMENEVLDPRVNDQRSAEIELFQVGFRLVVLSLQRFIESDWGRFEVRQEFAGVPMG